MQNHDLKRMVDNGTYDPGSNDMMPRYRPGDVTRDRRARERTGFNRHEGGHMFYLRTRSRAQLAEDVREVFESRP